MNELKKKEEKETKKRWTEIEVSKMANEEARIFHTRGQITNMNEELKKILPGRSIEGIKGKRRPDKYKKMVQDILRSFSLEPSNPNDPSSMSSEESVIEEYQALPETGSPTSCPSFNMLEEMEIYMSPKIYVNQLNSDRPLQGALT